MNSLRNRLTLSFTLLLIAVGFISGVAAYLLARQDPEDGHLERDRLDLTTQVGGHGPSVVAEPLVERSHEPLTAVGVATETAGALLSTRMLFAAEVRAWPTLSVATASIA